jgi:folate-dependent tRNA-U54 methylase TrmFO/GidA
VEVPGETMLGSLLRHVSTPTRFETRQCGGSGGPPEEEPEPVRFVPMNANFGLLPPIAGAKGRFQRRQFQVERALAACADFAGRVGPARGV